MTHEQLSAIEEILQSAVSETFEALAFEEVLFHETRNVLPKFYTEPMCWAEIVVLDPPIGPIILLMPFLVMKRFSEAIHSRPGEELGRQMIMDTFGEIINTLAGRLMAARLPKDTTFHIDLPKFGEGTQGSIEDQGSIASPASRIAVFNVFDREMFLSIPELFWAL